MIKREGNELLWVRPAKVSDRIKISETSCLRFELLSVGLFLMCCVSVMCCLSSISMAATAKPVYPFDSLQQQRTFQQLLTELRCLVCQNQNLANSEADLAADLRQEVYQAVREGQSSARIKQHLVQVYGPFILFKPAVAQTTWVLWTLPFLLLILGGGITVSVVRRYGRRAS